MALRAEVRPLAPQAHAELATQITALGVKGLTAIEITRLFALEGRLDDADRAALATALHDDVVEVLTWQALAAPIEIAPASRVVEVAPLPGVTDRVAETLLGVAAQLGVPLKRAATGTRYRLFGALDDAAISRIARELLANEVVERFAVDAPVPAAFAEGVSASGQVERVPLRAADDNALLAVSKARRLSLDVAEMRAIRDHYRQIDRDPTDVELEMLAQTWSEHCVHKTFRARIDLEVRDAAGEVVARRTIDSMLRQCLRAATERAAKPWIRSAFVDNAGIVAFDDELDLALKVETHNHPSALEPFGGANTGVGGVVRDILGVSARPIANTDVLCFGPAEVDAASLPSGVLHPRRVAAGVIAGIADYGNKMGIPTVAGAVCHAPGYTANPLVFCGCLGVLPTGSHPTRAEAGDAVVVLGGRTGRDGLRGATFSSMEMDHQTSEIAGTAVQIGHPIHEKQAQEVVIAARDAGLYHAITDCGAGGLSSAVGEMASKLGADIELSRVPLKYPGLQPWEIWLSEAQERMVLAVPPAQVAALQALCAAHATEATVIGHFRDDGLLRVCHGTQTVAEINTAFLHDGMPQRHLRAVWQPPASKASRVPSFDVGGMLLTLLSAPDGRSREGIVRRYDHEVQGGTVIKPQVGVVGDGPGNGAVLVPLAARQRGRHDRGVALGCGINPRYGRLDPYAMAWAAVDEAVRNCVVVGGDPDQLSLVDNFCWGNPALPDRLGGLVRCAEGCHDAAVAFGAPYISGKDSLNNEYTTADGARQAIPGTLLITAMALVPDVRHTATSAFKQAGDRVLLVGRTRAELGGSALFDALVLEGGTPPAPVEDGLAIARAVHRAFCTGRVTAAHDLSEGGLAVALAEMAHGGRLGARLSVDALPVDGPLDANAMLFSESASRYLLTVPADAMPAVVHALADVPWTDLGTVGGDDLVIEGLLLLPVPELTRAFLGG